MKRISIIFIPIILLFGCLLGGCSKAIGKPQEPLSSVVTSITVNYTNGPLHALRHYTHDEKIRHFLNYLRRIDAYGTPQEDPEAAPGSDIHIVLCYADGLLKVYRQKSERFLKEGDAPWKRIDATKAQGLGYLLGAMESDPFP